MISIKLRYYYKNYYKHMINYSKISISGFIIQTIDKHVSRDKTLCLSY